MFVGILDVFQYIVEYLTLLYMQWNNGEQCAGNIAAPS